MKKFILLTTAVILAGCAPPQYSAEDLAARGAKYTRGVVIKQSRGSFILLDESGEELTLRTGQLTQYIPKNYRSLKDDTVRVTYEEIWGNSGRVKLAVLQLEAIEVPSKNQPLPNPIEGMIVALGRGSMTHSVSILLKRPGEENALPIYVPNDTKPDTPEYARRGWDSVVGKTASVTARRIPIRRGNGYLYETEKVTVLE